MFGILFSPFNMTYLVTQESVIVSECGILDNMTLWAQMLYYQGFSRKRPNSMLNVICMYNEDM